MYTVAQVLSPEFGRSWHEVVAIVQAAAAQLDPGVALPGPEDLVLDEDGTLTFGFANESGENPVAALAGLLLSLLEGVEAPASLRDLGVENTRTSSPAHPTVASLSKALAFFERPNRRSDIQAVVARLGSSRQKSPLDEEFNRLREKVASAEPEKPPPPPARRKTRLSRRHQVIVLAPALLLVFGALGYQSGAFSRSGMLVGRAEQAIQDVISVGLDTFGNSKAASPTAAPEDPVEKADAEPVEASSRKPSASNRSTPSTRAQGDTERTRVAGTTGPAAARTTKSDGRESSAATVAPVPILPPAVDPPKTTARVPQPEPPVRRAVSSPPPAALPPASAVYSSGDPAVEAPVLVRPQFPREPAPGRDTGYFDILVDENGDVAEVKLISPRRLYHDRMLVAAAKAWKFKPAMLNGRPVKYRIRVAIILASMPGS